MRAGAGWIAAMVLALTVVSGAAAQERPGAVYVFGGATITHQGGAPTGRARSTSPRLAGRRPAGRWVAVCSWRGTSASKGNGRGRG